MGRMGLAIDGERLAWLALALVEPLAPRSAFALVERFGSPGAVLNAGESSLRAAGLSATIIAALGAVRPEREISVLARRCDPRHLARRRVSGASASHRRSATRARRAGRARRGRAGHRRRRRPAGE